MGSSKRVLSGSAFRNVSQLMIWHFARQRSRATLRPTYWACLKIWRRLATPAKRGAPLALCAAVALLIAHKPWEWNVPRAEGVADGRNFWWAGAPNFLLMVALATSRTGGDAAFPQFVFRGQVPSGWFRPDPCGYALCR